MAYSISTRPGMLPRGIFAKRLRGRNEVLNENMRILSHYEVLNNLIQLGNTDKTLSAHCKGYLTSLTSVTSHTNVVFSVDSVDVS